MNLFLHDCEHFNFITARKTKFAKVMFSQSVHRGGVCPIACWDTHTAGSRHPPEQTPWEKTSPRSKHSPGADTPLSRHPPGEDTPKEQTTPQSRHHPRSKHPPEQKPPGADNPPRADTPHEPTPPWEQTPPNSACWQIWATSRRYASYWNAYLLYRSGMVNSKSFVGKVLLRIKWKFESTVYLHMEY